MQYHSGVRCDIQYLATKKIMHYENQVAQCVPYFQRDSWIGWDDCVGPKLHTVIHTVMYSTLMYNIVDTRDIRLKQLSKTG